MEQKKVVGFLIAVFLVLSVLFLSLYRSEEISKTTLSDDFIEGAVENLSSSDIRIEESVIVRDIPDDDIYYFDNSDTEGNNERIIKAVIDTVYDNENVTTTRFDTPVGVSVGIYSGDDDSAELGRIVFSDNDFSFRYSKKGVSVSGADLPVFGFDEETASAEEQNVVDRICRALAEKEHNSYRISGVGGDENYKIVTAFKTIEKKDITDVYLNFVFENGTLVAATGSWFTYTPKAKYHESLTDGVNVLYKLNLADIKSVDGERTVYRLKKSTDNNCYLVPAWEISYTDKNDNARKAYFDALEK